MSLLPQQVNIRYHHQQEMNMRLYMRQGSDLLETVRTLLARFISEAHVIAGLYLARFMLRRALSNKIYLQFYTKRSAQEPKEQHKMVFFSIKMQPTF